MRRATAILALLVQVSCGTGPAPTGAPAVLAVGVGEEPLDGGLPGLDELGEAVVAGLNARDEAALVTLAIRADEYRGRLFPALVNHPAAEVMSRDLLWDMHARQSRDDLQRALELHGGAELRFVRLEPRGQVRRAGVLFHERPTLVVADVRGQEHRLQILASVIEHEATHTFKLLGYRDHA